MSRKVLDVLKSRFPSGVLEIHSFRGDDTAVISPSALLEVARFLKTDPRTLFDMPVDATCVDYLGQDRGFRFEVVYHLRSMTHNHRIRLKVRVPEDSSGNQDDLDSLYPVWRGFDWLEREVFDMFGIRFKGHPDLRRLLLYPEFKGHPLRKDYPVRGYQPLMDMPTLKGDPIPDANTPGSDENGK